jgi:hypothetical protein
MTGIATEVLTQETVAGIAEKSMIVVRMRVFMPSMLLYGTRYDNQGY